jgi:hypothetical protein
MNVALNGPELPSDLDLTYTVKPRQAASWDSTIN